MRGGAVDHGDSRSRIVLSRRGTLVWMLDLRVYRAAFAPGARRAVRRRILARRPPAGRGVAAVGRRVQRRARVRRQGAAADRSPSWPLVPRPAARIGRRRRARRPRRGHARRARPDGPPGVRAQRDDAHAADVETVVGVRPGLSSRRIVVIAHRDAAARRALAELSGTAALLELARLFPERDLRKTLVLASVSGGTGASRARARGPRARPAGRSTPCSCSATSPGRAHKPFVVPWSTGSRTGAAGAAAHGRGRPARARSGRDPGGSRATAQWCRRALPADALRAGRGRRASGCPPCCSASRASAARGRRAGAAGPPAPRSAARRCARSTAIDARRAGRDARAPRRVLGRPHGIVTLRTCCRTGPSGCSSARCCCRRCSTALDGFFRVAPAPRCRWRRGSVWLGRGRAARSLLAWAVAARCSASPARSTPPAAPVLAGALPLDSAGASRRSARALARARARLVRRCGRSSCGAIGRRGEPGRGRAAPPPPASRSPCWSRWSGSSTPTRRRAPARRAPAGCSPLPRARACAAAARWPRRSASGSCRSLVVALYYATALELDPLERALDGAARSPAVSVSVAVRVRRARRGSPASVAVLARAAHTPPRRRRAPSRSRSSRRGPRSYAGPGLLGGTESALRR